ncbi:MAG: hypothetical protein HC802_22940 [Caldilineaceae bacterium]|nr:hypothetical protein [Caldilineaceae bacterium]
MRRALPMSLIFVVVLLLTACQPVQPIEAAESAQALGAGSALRSAVLFEAIDVACADGNVVLSDSPFMAGASEVEVSVEEGEPIFSVHAVFHPDAYPDSSWILPGEGVDTADGGFIVYHSGDGTGAFKGSRIVLVVTPANEVGDLPCEPVGPVVSLDGVILSDLAKDGDVLAVEFSDIDAACPDGSVVISDEPLDAGRSEIAVSPEPDGLFFTVEAAQYPEAVPNGTWVTPGVGADASDGGFSVVHDGYGTGDLDGGRMIYIVHPAADTSNLPCEPVGPVVDREGVIILPR